MGNPPKHNVPCSSIKRET
ncbi:unnamed protein product, partial [Tuber melanosporum]